MPQLFTIGYSGYRQTEYFLSALLEAGVNALVDVRQWAQSSTFAQFDGENLRPTLWEAGISWLHLGRELGARPTDTALYTHGRVDYAKLADSPLFERGCQRLLDGLGKNYRICLMCSQKDPLICHRAVLIARWFELRHPEVEVAHLAPGQAPESQSDFGDRLMRAQNLYDHNMLVPDFARRRALAFARQGEQIAWQWQK